MLTAARNSDVRHMHAHAHTHARTHPHTHAHTITTTQSQPHTITNVSKAKQFPFGFVQLSVHGGSPCYGGKACYNMPTWSQGYAAIRFAQTAAVGTVPNEAMPNVFMATAVDIGEPKTPAGGK